VGSGVWKRVFVDINKKHSHHDSPSSFNNANEIFDISQDMLKTKRLEAESINLNFDYLIKSMTGASLLKQLCYLH